VEKVNVDKFRVPKFKLSFESSVVTVLKKLGLRLPFGEEADLSDMVEVEPDDSRMPLVVSEVMHKAVIEVNEEGTEAAAVTMFHVEYFCATIPPPGVDFVAFFLHAKTHEWARFPLSHNGKQSRPAQEEQQ
jgi:serpin B